MTTKDHETPQDHIARIRYGKFSLSDDGQIVAQNPLADDLQNSVNHLADGLYSEDIHFVLELIQNAEDNSYLPGQLPKLIFRLLPEDPTNTPQVSGALLVINNEEGLRPDNVDALCAVGKSTKVKAKRQGYIGEKGIGFKSVFKVARRPHLFSAGYHFYFDREPDPAAGLGYIVPYWIDSLPEDIDLQPGRTHILLPLDADKQAHVTAQLKQVAPETILFLSKLESLTVEIPGIPPLQLVADKSERSKIVLKNGDTPASFWMHRKEVTRPPDLREEKRDGVESREISVAFPLEGTSTPANSVFAYLPTGMQSGYPFLVNADFILATSRESILVDRPWNQWLREHIAPCFVEGFKTLVLKDQQHAYKFIPLKENIKHSFFALPVEKICRELSTQPVVWTFLNTKVSPDKARLAPASFWKLLENGSPPQQLIHTPLIRRKLEPYSKQLRAIGVETLKPAEIRACLQDKEWLSNRTTSWFVDLYAYLHKDGWSRSPLPGSGKSMVDLPIVLTSDGQLSVVGARTIYLPAIEAETLARDHAQLLDGLRTVGFLNADLYHLLKRNQELLDWVKRELAKAWTPEAYCRDLIKLLGQRAAYLDEVKLVQATKLIRDLTLDMRSSIVRELCGELPLRLQDGKLTNIQKKRDELLVTPANLEPDSGWQIVFPTTEDRKEMNVVSNCYLDGCNDVKERDLWSKFFSALQVTNTPVTKQIWTFRDLGYPPESMPTDLRQQIRSLPATDHYTKYSYRLTDVRIPDWLENYDADNKTESERQQQSRSLLGWLRRAWYSGVRDDAKFEWFYYRWNPKTLSAQLPLALRKAAWFPSTQGFLRPGEVFLDRTETREIFGDTVPYATERIDTDLAVWIGVRTSATVEEVFAYLKTLSNQPAEEVKKDLLQRIYSFLMERWRNNPEQQTQGQTEFAATPLIRVERPLPRWVRTQDAIWADRASVFGADFSYLDPEYPPRLRDFFVEQLGVRADVDDAAYARVWLKRQQEEHPASKRIEAAMERLFPVLKRVAEAETLPDWWNTFVSSVMIWTQDDRFLPPAQVFVPDDGSLKKLMDRVKVPFAWRPSKDSFANFDLLYKVLGVRSLAESTYSTIRGASEPLDTANGEERFLTNAAKRGICFYLWHTDKDEYARLREDGTLARLLSASEATVDQLELVYQLDAFQVVDPEAVAYFDRKSGKLYISDYASPEKQEVDIPAILSRFLQRGRTNRSLDDFIRSILGRSEGYLDRLIEKYNWRLLMEEKQWIEHAIAGELEWLTPVDEDETTEDESPPVEPSLPAGETTDNPSPTVTTPSDDSGQEAPSAKTPTSPPATPSSNGHGQPAEAPSQDAPSGKSRGQGQGSHTSGHRSASPTSTKPGSSKTPIGEQSHGRRRTYAEKDGHGQGRKNEGVHDQITQIERAGIDAVLEYEKKHGRRPTEHAHNHPGWDIDSLETPFSQDALPARRIEVKATAGEWGDWGIALTPTEYETARRYTETYYLYVVEHALDDEKRCIHVFHNPATKVDEYCFDGGWREYADETTSTEPHSS